MAMAQENWRTLAAEVLSLMEKQPGYPNLTKVLGALEGALRDDRRRVQRLVACLTPTERKVAQAVVPRLCTLQPGGKTCITRETLAQASKASPKLVSLCLGKLAAGGLLAIRPSGQMGTELTCFDPKLSQAVERELRRRA